MHLQVDIIIRFNALKHVNADLGIIYAQKMVYLPKHEHTKDLVIECFESDPLKILLPPRFSSRVSL